jgi:CheY-like chemotaxis protein
MPAGGVETTLIAILSDINMPGMDGLDLLGEIKQRYPEMPVMMVTAYGDDERRRRAEVLGAAEFLEAGAADRKPVKTCRRRGDRKAMTKRGSKLVIGPR